MKEWKNKYPLNILSGETQKEFIEFFEELLKEQKEELLNKIKKMQDAQYESKTIIEYLIAELSF